MSVPEHAVEKFRLESDLAYVVVADRDGANARAFGDARVLSHRGLVQALSGDRERLGRLAESLAQVFLPQIWSQGADVAYATFVNGLLVVMFESTRLDASGRYHRSKRLQSVAEARLVP